MMTIVLKMILLNSLLLFPLMGSAATEAKILQLREEINQVLKNKHNIDVRDISFVVSGEVQDHSRLETSIELLSALKGIKHIDKSLFDVDAIAFFDGNPTSRMTDLERLTSLTEINVLYIPINKDAKYLLSKLSTQPTDEIGGVKIDKIRDEEIKKFIGINLIEKSLLREIKMECHYRSPPVQIEVSSCKRDQNHLCISSGWCVDSRGANISFPSITCRVGTGNECPDAKLCLLGKGSAYLDSEVLTEMPYKLPKKLVPDTIFDKAVK